MHAIFSYRWLVLLWAVLILPACVDQDFDEPPVGDLTRLEANATIEELKALHTLGSDATLVTEPLLIEGVVVADDESGNLFRQIAIQDASGGIILRLNATGLFADYPVGTRLIIDAQGLYIGDFNNLYQINGSPEGAIEANLIGEHVFIAERGLTVEPTDVRIDALEDPAVFDDLLATLIRLEGVQFIDANTQVPYADAVNRRSVNLTLVDCQGNEIIVRTSGFADFANQLTPTGNGSVTALLTVFGDTKQLILRDETDVQLTGDRCGSGSTGGERIAISELRSLFNGGATVGPDDSKIQGVVISDKDSDNWSGRNLVLQDGDSGIVVRFTDNHNFALGEEIEVNVAGQELSEFRGLLQVNEVPLGNAASLGTADQPEPRETTVDEILVNTEAWESTLIRLNGVVLGGAATYEGGVTVTDETGEITLFTRSAANFAGNPLPSGPVDLIAVVSDFDGPQLVIRNLQDVIGGNSGGGNPIFTTALELRQLFADGVRVVPAGVHLGGVVISDRTHENITGRNLVFQTGAGGIVIRFSDEHSFDLGEELDIIIGGQELSEFNGLLQVNGVPNNLVTSAGMTEVPAPREATIAEVLDNMAGDQSWESTLVKITDVTFPEGGTFSGTQTVQDATASIAAFTRSQASFAGTSVPDGVVTVIAIVSEFNEPQLSFRSLNDVLD